MTEVLFGLWLAATLRLLVPFGWIFTRLRRVLPIAIRGQRQDVSTLPLGNNSRGRRLSWRLLRSSVGAASLAAYVSVVVGAVYFAPRMLVWAFDTPYPVATVSSSSMWPALKKGDVILVRGVDDISDVDVGDIVAFRHGGGITVHRLIEVSGDTLTTKGDANDAEDEPVQFDQVIGKLVTFRGSVVKLPQFGGLVSIFGPLVSRDAEPNPDALLQSEDPSSEETPPEAVLPGATELASVRSDGRQFDGPSTEASLSADGQFVAFFNTSDGLVYVRSRSTNTTEAVSVNNSGAKANRPASQPSISSDGRYVVFASAAGNLDSGDKNDYSDVFLRDRVAGTTRRISLGIGGADANGASEEPVISADGRSVAFSSTATNLAADDLDSDKDVFVVDLATGATRLVSVPEPGAEASGASQAPAISSSGRFIAFTSSAKLTGSDNNRFTDVFVWDRIGNRLQLVSVGTNAMPADQGSSRPSISADGRYVAFASIATNLVGRDFNRKQDVFVRDLQTARTERVSLTHNGSQSSVVSHKPSISGDGRFVTFLTTDGNIVPGDHNIFRDLFIFDRESGVSRLVSVDIHGQPADDHSGGASLSYDGTEIAFASIAEDLIEGDLNYWEDVFVRVWDGETLAPTTSRESR